MLIHEAEKSEDNLHELKDFCAQIYHLIANSLIS